jgi:hypothetical protein
MKTDALRELFMEVGKHAEMRYNGKLILEAREELNELISFAQRIDKAIEGRRIILSLDDTVAGYQTAQVTQTVGQTPCPQESR